MIRSVRPWLALACLLPLLLGSACSEKRHVEKTQKPLFVLSGAGLKPVLDPMAQAFTRKTGIAVEYSYLCSAMLLTNLELTRQGDVFVPGSKHYFNIAKEKGLVDEKHMVIGGYQVPCIMVQKGNPKGIGSLDDLLKPGMRLGVGDFEALAVGRLTQVMLKKHGLFDPFMARVEVIGGSATKLALPVCMNSIDAAINWIDTAKSFDHCADIVRIDPDRVMYSTFPVALTTFARANADAMAYFDFFRSPEGKQILEKQGYGLYFDPRPEQYVE